MSHPSTDAVAAPIALPRPADFDVDAANFSAPAWLNSVLSSPAPPDLSALDAALDDALRESHQALDGALQNALKAVPWVVRESERVRQRATALRATVDTVGERVAGVETSVVSSVNTIADADTVVRRVQDTAALLGTAATAERLLERLEALLASAGADGADLVAAADVVSQLRDALRPLDGIPELKDRFSQLESADLRLEKLAAPQLLRALEARNHQAAANARIVFDHAGRENAFRAQYVALRGAQVATLWTQAWGRVQQQAPPLPTSRPADSAPGGASPAKNVPAKGAAAAAAAAAAARAPSPATAITGTAGDLAAAGAVVPLRMFYDELSSLIVTEAAWLAEAFPDLKPMLLPELIRDSLPQLKDPRPRAAVSTAATSEEDRVSAADATAERLFTVAHAAIQAAARIGKVLLPSELMDYLAESTAAAVTVEEPEDDKARREQGELLAAIVDALTALLMPYRLYWDNLQQVAVHQARARAEAVMIRSSPALPKVRTMDGKPIAAKQHRRAPLADIALDVDLCTRELSTILDSLLNTLNSQTCGIGIDAMKQAANAVTSVFSERLLRALRQPTSPTGEDEWTRLSGALSLLISTGALKRCIDAKRESAFAVAVGTATPVLEVVSALQDQPEKRLQQFFAQVGGGALPEAGMVWELSRDSRLPGRVVTHFESLDASNDFQNLVDTVHRLVYETMFSGIVDRFSSFNSRNPWSLEGGDNDSSMLGFSSSPLRYATEVADYLITIPQQLEPFVPEEEDDKYAMPTSVYAFSKNSRRKERQSSGGAKVDEEGAAAANGVGDEEGEPDDSGATSFAGMWISVLAIGTMDLYVEKICSITKLTESGSQQLATDAGYICSVIGSLGVPPTPDMALVNRLLESKADANAFMEAAAGFESAEHRKLVRQLAAIRGINISI